MDDENLFAEMDDWHLRFRYWWSRWWWLEFEMMCVLLIASIYLWVIFRFQSDWNIEHVLMPCEKWTAVFHFVAIFLVFANACYHYCDCGCGCFLFSLRTIQIDKFPIPLDMQHWTKPKCLLKVHTLFSISIS